MKPRPVCQCPGPKNGCNSYRTGSTKSGEIDRLLKVLREMDAIFRIQPKKRLRPNRSHLEGTGRLNLLTRYGLLDLLASIGRNLGFPGLLPCSAEMDIGEGIRVRVLNLETIIAVKEALGAEKDLAALPILRATLAELRKMRGD